MESCDLDIPYQSIGYERSDEWTSTCTMLIEEEISCEVQDKVRGVESVAGGKNAHNVCPLMSVNVTYVLCITSQPFSNTVVPCHRKRLSSITAAKSSVEQELTSSPWLELTSLCLAHVYYMQYYLSLYSIYINCTSWSDLILLYLPENLLPLIEKDFRKTNLKKNSGGKEMPAVNRGLR